MVEAAKLAQEGASVEEIVARIEEVKQNSRLYIGVSTLENLVKGGRIGRVTGLLSSLLNIRVVMEMKNDELQPIVKGRGQKTFKKWLDELMQDLSGKEIAEIGISYAGGPDFANEMRRNYSLWLQLQSLFWKQVRSFKPTLVKMLGQFLSDLHRSPSIKEFIPT